MTFVRIPAGEFLMGSALSDTQACECEKPQSSIYLDEYWIGKYPVTNAQFYAFVQATGYATQAEQQGTGGVYTGSAWQNLTGANWQHPFGPNSSISGLGNRPVVQMSWNDAMYFTQWVLHMTAEAIVLPSEAQWEKAARGTDARLYPWGNGAPNTSRLNYAMNIAYPTDVGSYSPASDSPYGAADMAGNVWEWTSSVWGSDLNTPAFGYPYRSDDGREDQTSADARVLRGGSFVEAALYMRSANRYANFPFYRYANYGFRIAMNR